MIHILTVHWHSDKWIDIQLEYLRKNIQEEFLTYAFLNDIPADHYHKFNHYYTEPIREHSIKLNILSNLAVLNAKSEDDWLMFIDGDAFPIGDVVSYVKEKLKEYPLVAIQRRENHLGSYLPHPSFCVTTIKFWKEIGGNWDKGFVGRFLGKPLFEVGGYLHSVLEEMEIKWHPMLRSNKKDIHSLLFGIYDDLIYHHGAGFRLPTSRIDKYQLNLFVKLYFIIYRRLPNRIRKFINPNKLFFKGNIRISEEIYQEILNNPEFYNDFI